MKRLGAFALAAAFLLLQWPAVAFATAHQAAPPAQEAPVRLRLDVDQLNPRYLTSNSTSLNITGRLTNVGDRRLTKLTSRLELGERQTTERGLDEAMAGDVLTDTQTMFTPVAETLEPGQSVPLRITVPLGESSPLHLTKPGVYPLLVNVNGIPEFGGQARLVALTVLLPVLGAPGKGDGPGTASPVDFSVLWPIADSRPRVSAEPFDGQVTLTDDDLATSLAPGGRLDALVSAAAQVQDDSTLSASLCFGIDPDLLATVSSMTRGYQVRTPSGPVPGRGVDAAKRWLASLRQLVSDHCVVPMPYADADLSTLSGVRVAGRPDTSLLPLALGGANAIESVLGAQAGAKVQANVLWPDSPPDSSVLGSLAVAGIGTVLGGTGPDPGTITGSSLRAQPLDGLVTGALTGMPASPQPAPGTGTLAEQPNIAGQNGLGALAFRAGLGLTGGHATGPVLFAPPRHWNASPSEFTALLSTIGDFAHAHLLTPVSLSHLLDTPAPGQDPSPAAQDTSGGGSGGGVHELVSTMSGIDDQVAGLLSAMSTDQTAQVRPADLVRPVKAGLVRATSVAWHGDPQGAAGAADDARGQLDGLRGQVTILPPVQQISLASDSSPLPISIQNTLPVTVTVRITMLNNAGLRPENIQDQVVPARGRLPLLVPTEALRAGRFTVAVALSTPEGTPLGTTTRFELTSNEYGTITIVVTAAAGVALLLLSARRIYKRVKERGRAQM